MTRRMRILLLEDEASILFAMQRYFVALGRSVKTATTLAEGVEMIQSYTFDAVVADLRLGAGAKEDGLDFLAEVRHRQPSARTILLTAYGSPAVEERSALLGVDACLSKTQPLAEIDRVVGRLVKGWGQM